MMILRDEALCGVEIMKKLGIRSSGTIYPVLGALRERKLVDYRVEAMGATRKKIYFLTRIGEQRIRELLIRPTRMFCCDPSLQIKRILEGVRGLVEIKRDQKILCTLEHDEVKRFFRSSDITFSYDLNVPSDTYDLALSFLGVGHLIGKRAEGITNYVSRLCRSLKKGGSMLTVQIEKTDNMFARIFFEDILGLKESPGLKREELQNILERTGFKDTEVTSKSGLLYAVSYKT